MNILIICQYYYPEQFLINEIAPELVTRGNNVTVITGIPNYPSGVVFSGYKSAVRVKEVVNGVQVIRCPIVPRGKSKIQLLINYISYMQLANREAKRHDGEFDVVFLYQLTPILQAYPAVKYAQRNHKHLVCYCLDLAPASGNQMIGRSKLMHNIYRKFSKWAYTNCDAIGVTSKGFVDYLHDVHSIPLKKLKYLPQHASESLLSADLSKKTFDGIVDFMFAGNIGIGSRLEHVVYAVEKIKDNGLNCRMHFVGEGRMKSQLEKLVINLHLEENIVFHNSVPMSSMINMYRKTDALIVTLRKGQITVPSKVQAYMAVGKPIFGALDGSGKSLIEEAECGKCVDAEDAHGLAEIMSDFIQYPTKYVECGKKGREYFAQHFTLKIYVDKLSKLLIN